MDRYVLKPRPPVRAFVIAAVASLLGAVLMTLSLSKGASLLWTTLAGVVLALGVALALLAAVSMVRMRTHIDLDDKGYAIHGPGIEKSGVWEDVIKVTTTHGGAHLTLYHGEVGRTHILSPGGSGDPQMEALAASVAKHLDSHRGYEHF